MNSKRFSAKGARLPDGQGQVSSFRWYTGAILLIAFSIGLFYLVVTGRTRFSSSAGSEQAAATSTPEVELVPRRLDGVLVPKGEEAIAPRAVMVENEIDARPLSGPAKANVAIEAPVEGGITRFILFFDATSTPSEVGPVRSARPYYVDWALAWNAMYFHVGGSPEALQKIRDIVRSFGNVDEIPQGQYFWRAFDRLAPHNAYTNRDLIEQATRDLGFASSTTPIAWHFQDAASGTKRGGVVGPRVAYGGNQNVAWKYDKDAGVYVRYQSGKRQYDRDGAPVESENVIVMKTDAQIIDPVGRLRLRTIGSGEAVIHRDGNKYTMRWRRGQGEPIKFEATDGTEFLFTRGRIWIEVVTDAGIFEKI